MPLTSARVFAALEVNSVASNKSCFLLHATFSANLKYASELLNVHFNVHFRAGNGEEFMNIAKHGSLRHGLTVSQTEHQLQP